MDIILKNKQDGKETTLYLSCYGNENCASNKKCVSGARPGYSLHVVLNGKGKLTYGNGEFAELERGDAFLLFSDENYEYEPDRRYPWTYSWLTVGGENLEELFVLCGFTKAKPYMRIKKFDAFTERLKKLTDICTSDTKSVLEKNAQLLTLLAMLLERNGNRSANESHDKKMRSLRNAVAYIRDNYFLQLDVQSLAAAVFLSESYIKHLFAEMLDMSVTEYINRYRIAQACLLFQKTDNAMTDKQIAKEVGYDNYNYFVRMFAKCKGVSPREYKKTCAADDPLDWLGDSMALIADK